MRHPALDPRTRRILKTITELYLQGGESVSSGAVVQAAGLSCSPATVRVIMSRLAEEGYLEQPHTSAGRQPTRAALRMYIKHLMPGRTPPSRLRGAVVQALDTAGEDPVARLRAASRLLAARLMLPVVGRRPGAETHTLARMELVPIDERRLLVVAVLTCGVVRHQVVASRQPWSEADVNRCRNLINNLCHGLSLSQLRARLEAIEPPAPRERALTVAEGLAAGEQLADEALVVEIGGAVEQPAEGDYLTLLADRRRLLDLLDHLGEDEGGPRLIFGGESPIDGLERCGVIRAGAVAVVGPTRMDYTRIVPLITYVAQSLGDRLEGRRLAEA